MPLPRHAEGTGVNPRVNPRVNTRPPAGGGRSRLYLSLREGSDA